MYGDRALESPTTLFTAVASTHAAQVRSESPREYTLYKISLLYTDRGISVIIETFRNAVVFRSKILLSVYIVKYI